MPNIVDGLHIQPPTREQVELIRRFLAAFNAIEAHLRNRLQNGQNVRFDLLVTGYEMRYPAWRLGPAFREFGVVRNGLIHNETALDRYLYVPLSQVVTEIERQRKAFLRGEPVLSLFRREVQTITYRAPLTEALAVMRKDDYSQLPVYDGAPFKGLLTENGIARWLGRRVAKPEVPLHLAGVSVAEALREDEKRREVTFVPGNQDLAEVASLFISNPLLEAVIVTKTGQRSEHLLGIVTAWDIARLK